MMPLSCPCIMSNFSRHFQMKNTFGDGVSRAELQHIYLLFTYRSNWISFFSEEFFKTISFHYSRNKSSQKGKKAVWKECERPTNKMLTNTWQSSWIWRKRRNIATQKPPKNDQPIIQRIDVLWCFCYLVLSWLIGIPSSMIFSSFIFRCFTTLSILYSQIWQPSSLRNISLSADQRVMRCFWLKSSQSDFLEYLRMLPMLWKIFVAY